MRFIFCLFLLLSSAAFAQTPAPAASGPVPARAAAPAVPNWKLLGKPMTDDSKQMKDRFVYMNAEATDTNISLARPVLSQIEINDWMNEHLSQILTLDGKAYDRQVYANRFVFTPTGYADYIVYLRSANFAKFLKENQYKVTSFVQGSPEILSEGIQSEPGKTGVYRWQTKAILILSYLDYRNETPAALFKGIEKSKIDNRLPIQANVELVRVPMQEDGSMVAINHLSFTAPDTAKPTESLDQTQDGL